MSRSTLSSGAPNSTGAAPAAGASPPPPLLLLRAPLGAWRFFNLVSAGFYTDQKVFRAVDQFMVQFGISGDPIVSLPAHTPGGGGYQDLALGGGLNLTDLQRLFGQGTSHVGPEYYASRR